MIDNFEFKIVDYLNKFSNLYMLILTGVNILVLFIFLICIFLEPRHEVNYKDSSTLDYKFYLKNNTSNQGAYLDKRYNYDTKNLDFIDASFNYTFDGEKSINADYEYYVKANLKVIGKSEEVYYDEDDYLLNSNYIKNSGSDFLISTNVKIDYDNYKEIVNNLKNKYKDIESAILNVGLYLNVVGKNNSFNYPLKNGDMLVSLEVPMIDNGLIAIKENLSEDGGKIVYKELFINNSYLRILFIILVIISAITLTILLVYLIPKLDEEYFYRMYLDKIIKKYEKIFNRSTYAEPIVEMMNTSSIRLIFVNSLDEVIAKALELRKLVVYREITDIETLFFVVDDKVRYVYSMSISNYKKKKKKKEKKNLYFYDTDDSLRKDDNSNVDMEII